MNTRVARLALRNSRLDYHRARARYLLAAKALEAAVYRTDRPALTRKQA